MGILNFFKDNTLDIQIAKYEDLSLKKPQDPSIKNSLGDLYLKKMAIEKASQNYREAIDLFLKQRLKEKAIAVIKKTLSHDLFKIAVLEEIGDSLIDKGFTEDAVALYVQLARQKLNTNRPLTNDIFRKVLQIDPENSEALAFFQKGKRSDEVSDEELITPPSSAEEKTDNAIHVSIEDVPAPEYIQPVADIEKHVESFHSDYKQDVPKQKKPIRAERSKKVEEEVSPTIKDKFIVVAKEKGHLENIILQQTDLIKQLERDNADISMSLKNISEENSKLKEKLLNFDVLRNMEISELRKKIEALISDNKKLLQEKELILKNLDRDQRNISFVDGRNIDALIKEKQELENELRALRASLGQQETLGGNVRPLEAIESFADVAVETDEETLHAQNRALQQTIDELRAIMETREAEMSSLTQKLSDLTGATTELAELSQKLGTYEAQNAELKTDVDELTTSIEGKIKNIEELNEKISELSSLLEQKDAEASREVPLLHAKINELTASLDQKMEEISFYSKELADLNGKVTSLQQELLDKEHLVAEFSANKTQEAEQLRARSDEMEKTLRTLEEENGNLLGEIADTKGRISEYTKFYEEADGQRLKLDEELSALKLEFAQQQEEIRGQLSELQEALRRKDEELAEKNSIYENLSEELRGVHSAHESALKGIEEENKRLLEEITETQARISEYTKFYEEADGQRQMLEEQLAAMKESGLGVEKDFREKLAAAEAKNNELQALLDDREKKVSDAAFRLEGTLARLQHTETELAFIREGSVEAEQTRDALKTELDKMCEENDSLKQQKREAEEGLLREIASLREMTEEKQIHHFLDMLELKEKELAEAGAKLSDASARMEHAEAEMTSALNRASDAEETRDALRSELDAVKAELSTVQKGRTEDDDTAKQQLAVYEQEITALKEEIAELNASAGDVLRKEEFSDMQRQFIQKESELHERINSLAGEMTAKEALLSEHTKTYEKEKAQLESRLSEYELINRQLEEKIAIQSALEVIKNKVSENARLFEESDREKKELEGQLSEALNKILDIENQYRSMLDTRPSQEEVAELESRHKKEVDDLGATLAVLQADLEKLRHLGQEKESTLEAVTSENTALLRKISDMEAAFQTTVSGKEQEIEKLKNQISTSFERINDLEANLAKSLQENIALRKNIQGKPEAEREPAIGTESLNPEQTTLRELRGVRMDETGEQEKRRWAPYLAYALLVVAVLAAAGLLIKQYNTSAVAPKVEQPAVVQPLSYKELFDTLTREKASEAVKFQATMLTESLMQKENSGKDLPKYDFRGYHYFRININALRGALDSDFLKDPAASLMLYNGPKGLAQGSGNQVKEMKTFYKKEEPVSTAFIGVFSKGTDRSDQQNLELSLRLAGKELRLAWESAKLRAANVMP